MTLVSAAPDLGGTLTDADTDQWDLDLAPDGTTVERGIFATMYARLGDAFTPQRALLAHVNAARHSVASRIPA